MSQDHDTLATTVLIRTLSARATLPTYQSAFAAGLDLAACLPEREDGAPAALEIVPIVQGGRVVLVPCGFAMALAPGFEAQVRPRSGLATKFGVGMPNAPGTIDADYRGEVKVPLINFGQEVFRVEHGMRIAQMVIAPVAHAKLEVVMALPDSARGEGGFGSTGTR